MKSMPEFFVVIHQPDASYHAEYREGYSVEDVLLRVTGEPWNKGFSRIDVFACAEDWARRRGMLRGYVPVVQPQNS